MVVGCVLQLKEVGDVRITGYVRRYSRKEAANE